MNRKKALIITLVICLLLIGFGIFFQYRQVKAMEENTLSLANETLSQETGTSQGDEEPQSEKGGNV